jgi:hypothetical protein
MSPGLIAVGAFRIRLTCESDDGMGIGDMRENTRAKLELACIQGLRGGIKLKYLCDNKILRNCARKKIVERA